MGIINVLDKQTANLIAAGEVVERPSSAIKEMLENCADAGATSITVEIKNGGSSFIRVTDNGCGMIREDVPKCIMRHATSKIKTGSDLEAIATFGFRGEALAAISSVAKVRILTKSDFEDTGTLFECHFGEQITLEDVGCPKGTTITVENIFENVPARRKFLKKDSTEALAVLAACEKFALSRCNIALTFISDNTVKLQTPGDGNLKSAIYACLGREFASVLIPVEYNMANIRIHGFITKPEFSRPNRNMQNFFVNNRYIRSRTMMAAVEEGYRGFCPTGKFPACVLFCDIDLRQVDINVHPAKLEIKFSDERNIFDTIFFAVKNALARAVKFTGFTEDDTSDNLLVSASINNNNEVKSDTVKINQPNNNSYISNSANHNKDTLSTTAESIKYEAKNTNNVSAKVEVQSFKPTPKGTPEIETSKQINVPSVSVPEIENIQIKTAVNTVTASDISHNESDEKDIKSAQKNEIKTLDFLNDVYPDTKVATDTKETKPEIKITFPETAPMSTDAVGFPSSATKQREMENVQKIIKPLYIGEAFDTYIVCTYKQSFYLIDKHAAHERIIYERLKSNNYENGSQYLLEPIHVTLTPKEAEAASENKKYFDKIGFEFDEFGLNTFIIRSLPTPIAQSDAKDAFTFLAGKLAEGNTRSAGEIFDRALFTTACRAAIKAGDKNTDMDNKFICEEIFSNEAVLYCPHGRPVIYEFTKNKLDKMFDRL